MAREKILAYLDANRQRHVEQLCDFLRIPSISSQSALRSAPAAVRARARNRFATTWTSTCGAQAWNIRGIGREILGIHIRRPFTRLQRIWVKPGIGRGYEHCLIGIGWG